MHGILEFRRHARTRRKIFGSCCCSSARSANLGRCMGWAGRIIRSKHPVTIGIFEGRRVLIDGYVRSLWFLRFASPLDRIKVFVPVVINKNPRRSAHSADVSSAFTPGSTPLGEPWGNAPLRICRTAFQLGGNQVLRVPRPFGLAAVRGLGMGQAEIPHGRGCSSSSRTSYETSAGAVDLQSGRLADRADPKAQDVAATIGFEPSCRIMAGSDQATTEREHWRGRSRRDA